MVTLIPAAIGTSMKGSVQALSQQCRSIGLRCSLLLLDRGFYSVETIIHKYRTMKHIGADFDCSKCTMFRVIR